MKLSKRLTTVASFVSFGNRLADIGTDHAYIPIQLVTERFIPSAIAIDVRTGPLERAQEHIKHAGLEDKITTRLSDGLDKLGCDEVDTVLIAGMGGELMINILEAGEHLKNDMSACTIKEYVLSPQSEWEGVRKYLRTHNYWITDEDMIIDEGKYYIVIKALTSSYQKDVYSECMDNAQVKTYDLFGPLLINKSNAVLKEYLIKEFKKYTNIITDLKKKEAGLSEETVKRIDQIYIYMDRIMEAQDEMQRNS